MKHKISLMLLSSSLAINSLLPVYAIDINNPNDITNTEDESLAVLRDSESLSDEISIITDISNQELSSISTIVLNSYNEMYTGSQITPQVVVIPHVDGTLFQENIDYSVTYGENIEAGTGSVTVTGMGSYTGSTSIEFNISSGFGGATTYGIMEITDGEAGGETTPEIQELININNVATDVEVSGAYTYTESPITPTLTGLEGLTNGTDYSITYQNNTNAGSNTGAIIIAGTGAYTGVIFKSFTISPADISGAIVSVEDSYDYIGSAITPTPTVSLTGFSNPTYNVSYGDNKDVADGGSVTITGTGNFTGSPTNPTTFAINQVSVSGASVTGLDTSYAYTGSAIEPEVTVEVNGRTLTKGTDYEIAYTSNIESSTDSSKGIITITGKGNYVGTNNSTNFTIAKADISGATINGIDESYTYTGSAVEPVPTTVVLANGKLLTSGDDYTISYEDNTELGDDATIKVTGNGNYSGEVTKTFTIATADLSEATISGVDASYTYTGSSQTPEPVVSIGSKTLVKDIDYTLGYSTNTTDVSTVTITITGINNYADSSTSVDFDITAKDISTVANIEAIASQTYTGSQIIPENINITGVGSSDYSISYGDNINVEDGGSVTITGTGNYSGTLTENFTITTEDISNDATITITDDSHTYTGSQIIPTGITIAGVDASDYDISYGDNKNVADGGSVTITGKGNYSGTLDKAFTITAKSLSGATINGIDASYTYTGSAQTPAPTSVILDGKELVLGSDYTVRHDSNTAIGTNTAKVIITGINNYAGSTAEKTFSIGKKDLRELSITAIDDEEYDDGEDIEPTITITGLDAGVDEDDTDGDYYVTYKNNINVGTAYAVATGINAYSGTIEKAFGITEKNISSATITVGSQPYTGSQIKPSLTVTSGSANLTENKDYTIEYGTNLNVGENAGTVKLTGKGNYTGESAEKTFDITAIDLSGATINGIDASYTYNGNDITPVPTTVVLDGKVLDSTNDYEVTYDNNTDKGTDTAEVIITGKGNYTGTATETFSIGAKDISSVASIVIGDQVYTGSQIQPDASTITISGVDATDYEATFTYGDNLNVADGGTVTITGTGNYSGTLTGNFNITPKDITNDAGVSIASISDQVYTGSPLEPAITVTGLADGNYTTSYSNNTDASTTATATITGTGNYTGSKTANFTITAKSLSTATINGIDASYTYTGSAQTPVPTSVILDGKVLDLGTDYTVGHDSNTAIGTNTAKVIITGINNYAGSTAEKTFSIGTKDLGLLSIDNIGDKVYTGSAITPSVLITDLTEGTHFTVNYTNNTNVGTALAIATGKDTYSGTISKEFDITEATITDSNITGLITTATYTGSAITMPDLSITVGSHDLVEGTHYSVTYSNNTNIGADTATIKIVGIGNYEGSTIEKTFSITAKTFGATIEDITEQTYTGSQITPLPVVKIGDDTLTKDVDYTVTYETNLDVGVGGGTVTVTPIGGYIGGTAVTKNFNIVAKSISGAMVTGLDASYVYTGSAVDNMTITVDGIELAKDTDYNITYVNTNTSKDDNIEVGDVTATITGTGNYKDSIDKTFKIVGRDLSTFTITGIGNQEYKHGVEIKPTVTITDLEEDEHFSVSYSNNINAGTAYAIATGINTYSGSISEDFDITKFEITDSHVTLSSTSETYTGSPIIPDVSVVIGSKTLEPNTDYTLAYSNNTNVSSEVANVKVVGTGNYSGTITEYFDIVEIKLEDLEETVTITGLDGDAVGNQTYTGSAINPDVIVKIGETPLVKDVDYTVAYGTNLNVGTEAGTITINGKGIYSGELISTKFDIVQASLNDAVVSTLVDKEYNDDDDDKNQSFTVTVGGRTLTKDTDYTVGYTYPTTGVGEVTVTITPTTSLVAGDGLGNYKDAITRTFNINTLDISDATVNASIGTIDAKTYTGSAITPTPSVTSESSRLDDNYTTTWANNTNAGTATATITGTGIYSGSVSKDFTINKADVINATISDISDDETYTGSAITKTFTVGIEVDGVTRTTLTEGTDYTVSYDNNVSVGTSTVTITGIGNYTGTKSATFEIKSKVLEDLEDEVIITGLDGNAVGEQTYAGIKITPDVIVKIGETELRKNIDYTVTYGDNINAGDNVGTITIIGNGIYSGTLATENFTITPVTVSLADIADQTFTGSEITPQVVVTAVVNGFTQTLVEDTHYTVDYDENTDISTGTATASIEVIDSNYTGDTSKTFDIIAIDVDSSDVIIDNISDKKFTGQQIQPTGTDVVVRNIDGTILTQDVHYTLSYENDDDDIDNTSVGTGTGSVTVTGIGIYTGTYSTTFNIVRTNIADSTVTIMPINNETYTGLAIKPDVTIITDGGSTLNEGTDADDTSNDYYLEYGTNTDAGTGTVNIIGINNYSGAVTKSFTIEKINLTTDGTMAVINDPDDADDYEEYTGSEIKPTPAVTAVVGTNSAKPLTEGVDFNFTYSNNINSGTGSINAVALANSNFSGAVSGTFTIGSVAITTIEAIPDQEYTGSALKPAITVLDNKNNTLTEGTDYTIGYSANTNAGEATVTVTGKGNYTGVTKTAKFNIYVNLANSSMVTIDTIAAQDYSGSPLTPAPTVKLNGTDIASTNYTVVHANNTNVGTGTATITGNNTYYKGSQSKDFNIKAVDINTLTIDKSAIDDVAYTGLSHSPDVTITHTVDSTNTDLELNKDYTVTYSNNTNIGLATVTIQGINNYTGTVVETFNISKVDLSDADLSLDISLTSSLNPSYTGLEIEPTLTVKLVDSSGATAVETYLNKDIDYTVVYSNNINAGTGTATVTCIGTYTGTDTLDFTIEKAAISRIDPIPDQVYTGEDIEPESDIVVKSNINGIDKILDRADYELIYSDNINEGDATVKAEALKEEAAASSVSIQTYSALTATEYLTPTDNSTTTDSSGTTDSSTTTDSINATGSINSLENIIINPIATQEYTGLAIDNTSVSDLVSLSYKASDTAEGVSEENTETTEGISEENADLVEELALVEGVDYEITYENNTDEGIATVVVTFTEDSIYSGSIKSNFLIVDSLDGLSDEDIDNIIATYNSPEELSSEDNIESINTIQTHENIEAIDATEPVYTGNYDGYVSAVFKIFKTELSEAINVGSIASQTYTGSVIEVSPTITEKGGYEVSADDDYTISWDNNTNEGTAKVIITAKDTGKYTGSVETTFQIIKKNLSDATITITPPTGGFDATGNAIELTTASSGSGDDLVPAELKVTYGSSPELTLTAGTHYNITYSNNVNAGTATVTITGIGEYGGTNSKNFTINGLTIGSGAIGTITAQTYSGSALTPALTVKDSSNNTLVLNKDYVAEYSNNVNVATGSNVPTVTITGIGLYNGSTNTDTATFTINQFPVTASSIEAIGTQPYTGSQIKPSPTVKVTTSDGIERTLVAGTDYDITWGTNKDAGTGTNGGSVTITCKGNYSGTHTVNFDIEKATLSSAINVGTIANQTYTGSQITPNLSITANTGYTVDTTGNSSSTTSTSTDYTITYDTTTGTNKGTAKVTIASKADGRYTGSVEVYFQIVEKSITASTVTIDPIASQAYTGSALTPSLTIIDSDKPQVGGSDVPLVVGTDYSLAYSNNIEVGMATVTITGMGDYSGSRTVNFSITALDISAAGKTVISNIDTTYPYTSSAIKPTPVVVYDSKTLVEGTDYTVTYSSNNINVSTATPVVPVIVTITGIGKYSGTLTKEFTITPVNLTSILAMDNEVYTGSTTTLIKPEPVVTALVDGLSKTLTKTTDYTLSYPDTATGAYINEGSHTVKATGTGNYAGSVEQSFIIVQTDISDIIKVDPIPNQVRTGDAIKPTLVVKLASNDTTLTLDADYTVTYSSNIELGTAKATITPTSAGALKDYKNTFDVYFEIVVRSITDPLITVDNSINDSGALDYTGSELTPDDIVLTDTSKTSNYTLEKDKDYTLSYSNNKDVGTASITITGIGNYSGTLVENFVIGALDISSYNVTGLEASYNYTGSAIEPTFTLDDNAGYTLVKGVDYTVSFTNNTESTAKSAASATITITGTGKYTGSITSKTFNITQANITRIGPVEDQAYTGADIKPSITVYADVNGIEKVLTSSDYKTPDYSNNREPSTASTSAKISVDALDSNTNYTGSAIETYFRIIQTALTDVITVDAIPNKVYTSETASTEAGITLSATDLVVRLDGTALTAGTDYTVSYLNNKSEGTATVIIEAKAGGALDLYSGTHSETFRIVRNDIADSVITINPTSYDATGNAIELTTESSLEEDGVTEIPAQLIVKYNGTALVNGTHYSVAYSNNINSGNATVTITGIGDYAGSVNKNFTINGLTIDTIDAIPNQTYTGEPITPSIVVKDGTTELVKDLDYTVGYSSNNIDVTTNSGGTTTPVTVTATGIGKYAGSTQTQTFLIDPVTILSAGIEAIPDQTYTKSAIEPDIKVTAIVNMQEVVLTKDTDYTIDYTGVDNINAGTGVTPIITGIGNYDGTPTASFNIVKTAINDSSITISPDPIQDQTYTESAITIDDLKLVSNVNGILVEANNDPDYDNNDYTVTYESNTNIGTAKITISATPDSLYSGSKVLYFNIVQKSVADLIIDPIADQTFTGSALSPTLTIKDGDYTLSLGTDYSVSYVDNINAGTATVIITGIGQYGGTINQNFIIDPIDISVDATKATITVSDEIYTGTDVLPTIVVTSKAGVILIKDVDYTVGYNNNIETGTASITISGINNYTGVLNENFEIERAEITSIDPIPDKLYTGSAITIPNQEIVVRSTVGGNSKILVNGRDYTVTQDITTLVGLATISVNGMGNYTDPTIINPSTGLAVRTPVSQTFNINQGTLADVTIASIPTQPYNNGSQVIPPDSAIVVRATDGTLLTKGTSESSDTGDYIIEYGANTSLGSNAGSITIKPSENSLYTGEQTVTFNISQTDISNELFATVTPSIANQTYNGGTAIEPAVSVTLLSSGATLTQSTNGTDGDYTVSYSNNINKGTATVTITGINDYSGIVTREFTIDPADLTTAGYYVDSILSQTYTSNAIAPTVTVRNSSNNRLILSTDYTVGYTNNTNAGTATVNITGTGNYTGTLNKNFTIDKAVITRVEAIPNQAYTGSAITPEVVVVAVLNGVEVVLTKDVHYETIYSNNINETTASSKAKVAVMSTLGGNYTGNHDVYFEIVKMSVNDPSISLTPSPIPDQYYTGSDITIDDLALKSIVGNLETTLVKSTDNGLTGDYKVTYSSNREVGTATILIEGINSYTGSRSITFNIGKVSITDPTITIDSIPNQVYTGSVIEPTLNINHIVEGVANPLVKDQDYTVVFNSNTEVGTATAVITGIGKYTGSVSKTFTIQSFNLATAVISPIADQVYTGSSITPLLEVKITVDRVEHTLVKDIDYTVGFTNNVEVGTSTVTISGAGKYAGTKDATFNITPIMIQKDGITPNPIPDQAYAGMAEVKPELLVKSTVNGLEKILTENLDYTLSYWNNQDMGTASVRVSGINNFTNPKDILENSELVFDFEIVKTDLADTSLVIVDNIPNQVYQGDGVAITPTLTVTLADGTPLVLDSDYTVSYSNNTGVGTATATITAVDGSYYTGSRDIDFEIVRSDISDATFATITPNTLADSIYIGTNVNYDSDIAINLVNGGATLVQDQDYTISYDDNINAGLVTVTISGMGLYAGTITKTFNINPIVLTTGLIEPIPNQPYTNTHITLDYPDLTINPVQVNGADVTLVEDQDYTLEYTNNIEPGTAILTLTGIGNYTGVLKETFVIEKYDISDFEQIEINITEPTYTGSQIVLDSTELQIIHKGEALDGSEDYTLVENTDFTVNYNSHHINAGEVSITITGTGVYSGSTTKHFNILPRDIAQATTTPSIFPDETYTSLAITPDVTGVNLIDLDGMGNKDLELGTEYTVSYANNTEIGVNTASVILTGTGNYTGTAEFNFTIEPISLTSSNISIRGISEKYTYDGTAKEPSVSIKDKKYSVEDVEGYDLVQDKHFTITYSDNIDAGTATITFTGIGIYKDTTTINFDIAQKSLSSATVNGIGNYYAYTGNEIKPTPTSVKLGDAYLQNTDYDIVYYNNIEPASEMVIGQEAIVEIVGKNNYTGSVNKIFYIYQSRATSLDNQLIDNQNIQEDTQEQDEALIDSLVQEDTQEQDETLIDSLVQEDIQEQDEALIDSLVQEDTQEQDEALIDLLVQEDIQEEQVNTLKTSTNLSNVLSNFLNNNLSNITFSKNINTESKSIFTILSNLFKK